MVAREGVFRAWVRRHRGPRAVVWDTHVLALDRRGPLALAEFGHSHDDEDLPQINLCLAAKRDTGLPLWCRPLLGSVPENRSQPSWAGGVARSPEGAG